MNYFHPALDVSTAHDRLVQHGRVLIRDFFEPVVADALARSMASIDWSLTFRDASGDCRLRGDELRALSPAERFRLTDAIQARAASEFQFSFLTHSLVHSAHQGHADLLTRFVRWMADEPFMSLMRELGGTPDINRVYAQATMYTRGSFLVAHDDHVDSERRRLAYVINLTREWRPDWGGLLHFSDEQGNVVETFFPHFNSMSLFRVPQTHFVSYVPPFAQRERYSITGWLIAG